eukprot:1307925-Amphidinium_carterae.1
MLERSGMCGELVKHQEKQPDYVWKPLLKSTESSGRAHTSSCGKAWGHAGEKTPAQLAQSAHTEK